MNIIISLQADIKLIMYKKFDTILSWIFPLSESLKALICIIKIIILKIKDNKFPSIK